MDSAPDPGRMNPLQGQFDPRTLVLLLSRDLAPDLDSKGGALPEYSIESGPTAAQRSYSTHLHETIHYWQSIGSTAGFLLSLGESTATFAALDDLKAAGHRQKPVLDTLDPHTDHSDPAFRACILWTDVIHGCAVLDDPAQAVAFLENRSDGFVSVGHSLLSLCSSTASSLAEAFDPGQSGLVDSSSWQEAYEEFVRKGSSGFEPGSYMQIPIGLRDLAEGQARISEIQHRNLTQEALSWADVRSRGWLAGVYGKAFDTFLHFSGFSEPESPRDNPVNLFLLLCDIALNPAVGYAAAIDPAQEFVHDFHPGIRFIRLCRAIAKDPSLTEGPEMPSLDAYETLSRKISERLGWLPPTEVARTLLTRWEKAARGDELADQHYTRNYGADPHRRFVIGEHRNFLDTRVQIPHFFCWPAWQHLIFEGEGEYASTIDQVLRWHRPPFTAEEGRGVTTVEIARLKPEEQGAFVASYFGAHAIYDLTRQWIEEPDAFRWNRFAWKSPLPARDIEWLEERFAETYGLRIDEIAIH